ncbi:iron-containing redox enzyme family protein [Streptomyces sp. V4-01]|uniref:Iron-containing redox enzyme family protein n=1 Tax=Actinacidiphila polyblastidii TaxID=3110430 RepID=A0ABU7PND5_9ACTN|nr:iron-containing redox enzyme family protein [Streptomyces sp. V4-01]
MTTHQQPRTASPARPAPLSNSAALRAKLDLFMPRFFGMTSRFWTSSDVRERYPAYLSMLHGAIRSTVPLMELALERSRALAPQDPVAAALVEYFGKHIGEERGHDRWLLQDLVAIGRDPGEPSRAMPRGSVANLVGAQYYWIRHHHPVCLIGHIAVLEGYPPSPALADNLREATGYPADGFRTLRRHATLDVRHRDELLRTLDELPLTAEQAAAVGVSALHTLESVIAAFAELLAGAPPASSTGPAA